MTWVNSGLPSAMSAVPGVFGYMPIADQTYQALIVPRSSLPTPQLAGLFGHSSFWTWRTFCWVFHGWPT